MPTLHLAWIPPILTPNCIAFRASKRIKYFSGMTPSSWMILGFTPTNDMALSITEADATVIGNKLYQFKVEMICTSDGPALNVNGLQDGIGFQCVSPNLSSDNNSVTVNFNVLLDDIDKIRITLKKQSDNSIVGGPVIVNKIAHSVDYVFTGLDGNTGYYVTAELYAIVNGVEAISSDPAYLGAPCGGNIDGSQISTTTPCVTLSISRTADPTSIEWTTCDGTLLSSIVTGGGIVICTNGDPVNVLLGGISIDMTTPGSC